MGAGVRLPFLSSRRVSVSEEWGGMGVGVRLPFHPSRMVSVSDSVVPVIGPV